MQDNKKSGVARQSHTTAKKVVKKTHIIGRDFGCSICMQPEAPKTDTQIQNTYVVYIYIFRLYRIHA